MKQNQHIQNLLDKGNVGDYLSLRGGFGESYTRAIFTKMSKNKVIVSQASTWSSRLETKIQIPVCIITDKHIIFKGSDEIAPNSWHPDIWKLNLMASFGEYETWKTKTFPIKIRWILNANYIVSPNVPLFIPFKNMKFDWEGNILNQPKSNKKKTEKLLNQNRLRNNAQSRARYRSLKADRDFRKHRENDTIETWDFKEVLAIKNAQVRQQAIELIGINRILDKFPIKILDSNIIDKRPYELLEIEIPNIDNWNQTITGTKNAVYLKMTNPSTGEYHMEGVPRKDDNWQSHIPEDTVIAALAWRDGETERVGFSEDERIEWKYNKPQILT